ncbi:hypothetical protein ACLOJK_008503 [Asimina triloba]
MAKKELISSTDLHSIEAQYGVPMEAELSATRYDETYKDRRPGFIYANELMLKVGVKLSSKFSVVKALNVLEVKPLEVGESMEVYIKTEEVAKEQVRAREEARKVGVKVSPTKDLKTMLIEAEDGIKLPKPQENHKGLWEGTSKRLGQTAEQEVVSVDSQTAEEKRGGFFIPKAWALKILEDLLPVESMVIRENAALGLEPKPSRRLERA